MQMTRRERLLATLRGEPVDRPAVNFYEIGGYIVDPADPDPFNVYNSQSWKPLLDLAETSTDIIRTSPPALVPSAANCRDEYFSIEQYQDETSKYTKTTLHIADRTLTSLYRVDKDVNTTWVLEHLCKDGDDLKAYLQLPDEVFDYIPDTAPVLESEARLGDKGIITLDAVDPLCMAAELFSMADFTIIAMTQQVLFHELLQKIARSAYQRVEKISKALPGRLWRIVGPEYATPPYLPPELFREYVVQYDTKMIELVHRYRGYARVHCHGKVKAVLPMIAAMGADAIDPLEPPQQGDIELIDARREYGKDIVLFGNLEITDIENMESADFEKVVRKALYEGTFGTGRGFVLMPSAAPYGRQITDRTLKNYETMVRLAACQ